MKLTINLHKISENCYFEGKIYHKNAFLSTAEVADLFRDVDAEDILQILPDIDGFFYLAIETGEKLFLITDIVRSLPLFYKKLKNEIFIAKNAFDLSSDEKISIENTDAFLTCGYTLGNKTIFENIFQAEAANLLSIEKADGKTISTNYYCPVKSAFQDFDKEELFSKLNETYAKVVQKAIDYAAGRTIVVPLSGGYDSRLVAMTLKKLGAKNVVCYAYGTKQPFDIGRSEINASKQVAEMLGYKWIFVKYSYSKWKKLVNSSEAKKYIDFVSRGVSLISYQEWLAVLELKTKSLLPRDSIFIPGHTGDFITGAYIPLDIDFDKTYSKQQLQERLSKGYFKLFPIAPKVALKICETFAPLHETYAAKDYVGFLETFSWKEFHAKHICNSAQVYSFYGYDCYFPLWDKEIVDLWFSVHPKQKIGRALYREFAEKYFKTSIPYVSNGAHKNLFLRGLFKICHALKLDFLVNNQYGIAGTNKLSFFLKTVSVPDELKNSFVLENSSKKLRKISLNGIGALQTLLKKYETGTTNH